MSDTEGRRKDTRDIVKGALVNLAGTLARSLNLILVFILGRLYGPEGVGLFLLARATVDIVSNLGILGMNHAVLTLAARRHAEGDADGMYRIVGQAVVTGLAVSFGVTVGLTLLAPWLTNTLFNKPELLQPLRIMTWVLPFWTLSAVLLFATRALRVMQYEIIVKSIVEPACTMLLAVLFYSLGLGLIGMYLAVLFAALAGALAAIYCFDRMLSLRKLWRELRLGKEQRRLCRFAVPIGLQDLINELQKKMDIFLVGRYLSADLLGIYGIAQEAAYSIRKIRQAFNPIFIPVISASHQNRDHTGMRLQYGNVTRWILILDIAYLMIVFLAGRSVMHLFGAEFVAGAAVLTILSTAMAINGIVGVSELLTLTDKPWINLVNAIWSVLASAGLNLLLIPRYGIMGAACAALILNTVLNSVRFFQVALLYKLQPFTRYHAKIVAASILSIGAVWGARQALGAHGTAADLSALLACWILYFTLISAFGPAPEERKIMERLRKWISFGADRSSYRTGGKT
jgi:O-antigen/teichoic acid export membrane protein